MSHFRDEIRAAINRNNMEAFSNTPDFVLAEYLTDCLATFDRAVKKRDAWYGISPEPGFHGVEISADEKAQRGGA